jgi:glutamate racemase
MIKGANLSRSAPIGIFDSGIGGLTVARAINELLPGENLIYFGDTAHLPYGDKSSEAIRYYVSKISDFLYQNNCKALVIACNTASSVLERSSLPPFNKKLVINVVDPLVNWFTNHREIKSIGVIGTKRTIKSGIYLRRLRSKIPEIEVKNLSTPLLAPMIEEGFFNNNISKAIIASYLDKLPEIDALILACTHYPLIKNEISAYYHNKIPLIDAPFLVAEQLANQLDKLELKNNLSKPKHQFIVSDFTDSFEQTARLFFGESVHLKEKNIWKQTGYRL